MLLAFRLSFLKDAVSSDTPAALVVRALDGGDAVSLFDTATASSAMLRNRFERRVVGEVELFLVVGVMVCVFCAVLGTFVLYMY